MVISFKISYLSVELKKRIWFSWILYILWVTQLVGMGDFQTSIDIATARQ